MMSEWVQQGNIRITSNETGVPASSGDMSVYHLRKGLVEKLSEILWWIFFFQTGLPCVLIICPERSFHLHQISYCFARMIIIVQLRKFLEVWKLINKFEFRERRSVTPFSLIMSKKKKKKKEVSADSVWWKHLNVLLQGWGRWDVQLVPENYTHD